MEDHCQNCRNPEATLRSVSRPDDPASVVFLCEACDGALEQGFVWAGQRAN